MTRLKSYCKMRSYDLVVNLEQGGIPPLPVLNVVVFITYNPQ